MKKNQKKRVLVPVLSTIGVLLALLAGAWIYLFGIYDDPALAELQREFDASITAGGGPPEGMRERMEGLSEQQRRRFFMRNREKMMQAMSGRMTEFLNQPPEQLRREIADRADRIVAARASGEAGQGFGGPPGGRPGGRGPGGPGGDRGEMTQSDRMKRIANFTSPEMRAGFSETKRLIDDELARRGEPQLEGPEMRFVMRGGRDG